MNFKNINLLGLNTYASHRVTEQNYLLDCNNIIADQLGVIGTRRGQSFFGQALTSIKQIFTAINELFVSANDTLYYDNSGTFSAVSFTDTTSYNALSNRKIALDSQNKSLFFNGKRISDETGAPVDLKIKKLTSSSSSVNNAGLEAPINLDVKVENVVGGNFIADDSVRIRVFYQYTDANGYLITSPVSQSIVATNDTANPSNFILSFQIPYQFNLGRVDVYYAVSSTVNGFTPDDNLFWGSSTVIAINKTINAGITSVFTNISVIPRDSIVDPVDLYTNASQEGILQNNDPPINSKDIETYSGHTFYANCTGKNSYNFQILEFPLDQTILTYEGISYQRSATSDYNASPVLFSGANATEYSIDFARAFSATQPEYNAIIDRATIGEMGHVVGWVEPGAFTQNAVTYGSCLDNSGNIYAYENRAGTYRFYKYSIYSNTISTLASLPGGDIVGNSLVCVPTTNKVYSIGGYILSSGLQAPVYIYDINTDSWTTGASMPAAPGGSPIYLGTAAFVPNSTIYYFFGRNLTGAGVNQNYWYKYDIVTNTFTGGGTIPTTSSYGRVQPGSAYIPLNFGVYIFGGQVDETASTSDNAFFFNVSNETFTALSNMSTPRVAFGCAAVGGLIYLINGANGATTLSSVEYYDVATDTYTGFTSTIQPTSSTQSVYFQGSLYKIGGTTSGGPSNTNVEVYKVGGINFRIEDRYISDVTVPFASSLYIAGANFPGTSSPLNVFSNESFLFYSKQGQPESVPFLNNFSVGSASSPILRIAALRSSLIILKSDGLFQLNGVSPETFGLQELDPTCELIAAASLAKLDNEIYCLTSEGVVAINESGARIISYKIKDLIDQQLYSVPTADWNSKIVGVAYDLDFKYVLTIGDKTFSYNYVTDQWTIWHAGNSNINSWAVFENKLYYADTTRVYQERKSFTDADYQDENGDGLSAFMEFNNLEFSPGKIIGIQAMQILQRKISDLTVTISAKNNFNTPVTFTKLLDKFISRVMFPNGSRTAFYFRPNIAWDTEVVATPGTFSDTSFEGLDFEFEITDSNII
jgi:hypothetical protein